jgi:hypothetical protein
MFGSRASHSGVVALPAILFKDVAAHLHCFWQCTKSKVNLAERWKRRDLDHSSCF